MLGFLKRLGALTLLLGLLLGFPALLIAAVGNPWPDGGLNELSLMSNAATLGIISLLGWFVWAQLLLCTLWEIPPALRQEPGGAVRLPLAVDGQQRFIRMLVHIVLAVGVTSTTLLGSHATRRGRPRRSAATGRQRCTPRSIRSLGPHPERRDCRGHTGHPGPSFPASGHRGRQGRHLVGPG